MKVLLVDQIAKVNYKYTFPLANGLEKAGAKVLLAIDQKQEKENCRCERINHTTVQILRDLFVAPLYWFLIVQFIYECIVYLCGVRKIEKYLLYCSI